MRGQSPEGSKRPLRFGVATLKNALWNALVERWAFARSRKRTPRLRPPHGPVPVHLVFEGFLRRRVEGQPEALGGCGPQVGKQVHLCL